MPAGILHTAPLHTQTEMLMVIKEDAVWTTEDAVWTTEDAVWTTTEKKALMNVT